MDVDFTPPEGGLGRAGRHVRKVDPLSSLVQPYPPANISLRTLLH